MINSIPCGDLELNIAHPHGMPTLVPSRDLEEQWDWRLKAIEESKIKVEMLPPVAVHLHVHYLETLQALLCALERCSSGLQGIKLWISTNSTEKAATIETIVAQSTIAMKSESLTIRVCPNRGRNLGPLLHYLWQDLSKESLVLHLHGKRSVESNLGEEWLEQLLIRLLPDSQSVLDIRKKFYEDKELGLLIPQCPETIRPHHNWGNNFEMASQIWKTVGGHLHHDSILIFPTGGMFWAQPAALAPLAMCCQGLSELPPEPIPVDATSLHALERLVAHSCETSGHSWSLICNTTRSNSQLAKKVSVLQPRTEDFQQATSFLAAMCRNQEEKLTRSNANLKRCTEQLNQQIISSVKQLEVADSSIRQLMDTIEQRDHEITEMKKTWHLRVVSLIKRLIRRKHNDQQ